MINDLPTHSVIPSTKSNCSLFRILNIQQSLVFFLEKSRSQKRGTVLASLHRKLTAVTVIHCWKGLIIGWRKTDKIWDLSKKFLTKFALLTNEKMAFLGSKILWSLQMLQCLHNSKTHIYLVYHPFSRKHKSVRSLLILKKSFYKPKALPVAPPTVSAIKEVFFELKIKHKSWKPHRKTHFCKSSKHQRHLVHNG